MRGRRASLPLPVSKIGGSNLFLDVNIVNWTGKVLIMCYSLYLMNKRSILSHWIVTGGSEFRGGWLDGRRVNWMYGLIVIVVYRRTIR